MMHNIALAAVIQIDPGGGIILCLIIMDVIMMNYRPLPVPGKFIEYSAVFCQLSCIVQIIILYPAVLGRHKYQMTPSVIYRIMTD
ncbi:hypothetical protein D3C76_1635160 [compost metagenome]